MAYVCVMNPIEIYSSAERSIYQNEYGSCLVVIRNGGRAMPVLYDKTKQEMVERESGVPFGIYCVCMDDQTLLCDRLYNTVQISVGSPAGYPFYLAQKIFLN